MVSQNLPDKLIYTLYIIFSSTWNIMSPENSSSTASSTMFSPVVATALTCSIVIVCCEMNKRKNVNSYIWLIGVGVSSFEYLFMKAEFQCRSFAPWWNSGSSFRKIYFRICNAAKRHLYIVWLPLLSLLLKAVSCTILFLSKYSAICYLLTSIHMWECLVLISLLPLPLRMKLTWKTGL